MTLKTIHKEISACRQCPLGENRMGIAVPGEGSPNASLFFIGEKPTKGEAKQGRHYIGKSGAHLRYLMKEAGIDYQDTFITSTLCCCPPENRDPTVEELEQCWGWTEEQLDETKPEFIVAVGRFAARQFIDPLQTGKQRMGDIHGIPTWAEVDGRPVKVFPSYHPAAGLFNTSLEPVIREDFETLGTLLRRANEGDYSG